MSVWELSFLYLMFLLLQCFCHFFEKADNGKMLRTRVFTLSTLYACRCFLASSPPTICVTCFLQVAKHLVGVHHGEYFRNMDFHRTAWRAVMAGGACDTVELQQGFASLFHHVQLLVAQWVKLLHKREVILHLSHVRHPTQYHHHARQ